MFARSLIVMGLDNGGWTPLLHIDAMLLLTFYLERKNGYRKRACKVKLVIG